ncbi:MAG: DUF697 domain-containing protein [Proteobacteria bacterium]|nr:DUF697 domain-containing protein [Pseudomonadota bacterium]MDA1308906.1 DUF697 domain-containing protein [Pseudomonadota bacterium]
MDETVEARRDKASSIIKTYMGWSAGAAFLPLPYVDLAAVTAVQVKMVADLAAVYEVPFARNAVKSIVAGLIGSALPSALARGASSLIKAIPGVGTFLGAVTAPAFSSASTYAIGRIFVQHFEAGGNILNFDPDAMREHFKSEFDSASADDNAKTKAAA